MNSDLNDDTVGLPEEISWKAHPFTENAGKSVLLVVIILAVSFGAFTWLPYLTIPIGAALFLVISMAPYLFPTRYKIDRDGIEIKFVGVKSFRSWDEFRNFYPHTDGVHLSTLKKPGPLDSFRGSYIRFEPGKRDLILRFLEGHIKRPDVGKDDSDKKNGEGKNDLKTVSADD